LIERSFLTFAFGFSPEGDFTVRRESDAEERCEPRPWHAARQVRPAASKRKKIRLRLILAVPI
jgi:hypothetical protein